MCFSFKLITEFAGDMWNEWSLLQWRGCFIEFVTNIIEFEWYKFQHALLFLIPVSLKYFK